MNTQNSACKRNSERTRVRYDFFRFKLKMWIANYAYHQILSEILYTVRDHCIVIDKSQRLFIMFIVLKTVSTWTRKTLLPKEILKGHVLGRIFFASNLKYELLTRPMPIIKPFIALNWKLYQHEHANLCSLRFLNSD